MHSVIVGISFSLSPLVVSARVPIQTPEVTKGLLGSLRMVFLFSIMFDPNYIKEPGYVSELYPNTIILGSQALVSESEPENTIAHELNHWRS